MPRTNRSFGHGKNLLENEDKQKLYDSHGHQGEISFFIIAHFQKAFINIIFFFLLRNFFSGSINFKLVNRIFIKSIKKIVEWKI